MSDDIVKTFNTLCGGDFPWRGMWISDEEWAKYVQPDSTIPLDKRRKGFNTALGRDVAYTNLLSTEAKNDRGVYRHVKCVKASNEEKKGDVLLRLHRR
jgi:hypothetical protein